jgi:CHAT domain-containing protein
VLVCFALETYKFEVADRRSNLPDWNAFRLAFCAGLPLAELVRRTQRVEAWLALPEAEAMDALEQAITGASESQARRISETLSLLRIKLQRDIGLPPGSQEELKQFLEKVEQGRGSESDCRYYQQMAISYHLTSALCNAYPALKQPSSAELASMELRKSLTTIFNRFSLVAPTCAPGRVTPESIHELEQILEAHGELVAHTAPGNPALPEAFYAMGHIALMLAKSCVIVGRNQEGFTRFELAARYFEKGGDPNQAADCRSRAQDLAQSLSADFDKAAGARLDSLITSEHDYVDPLKRAKALAGLVDVATAAGDIFEAVQNAKAAAKELDGLGFKDPLEVGVDDAVTAWITTACSSWSGTLLLSQISQVVGWYLSIFAARLAAAIKEAPTTGSHIESLVHGIISASLQMQQEAAAADAELQREWAVYAPTPPNSLRQTSPQESTSVANLDRGYSDDLQRMRELDSAILKLREQCNERASSDSKEDLLTSVERLQSEAAALSLPVYEAKCLLERTYILLSAGRAQEALPLAQEARRKLLAGRSPSLASFSQGHERALYLDSLSRQEMAQAIKGDFEGAWKTCEETIQDFETQRYRVNSPYRQSAILSSVTQFYTHGAFAACKLSRWDDMLETIELIKARSAIRSRLIPDLPEFSESDLLREFEQVSSALAKFTTKQMSDNEEFAELTDRRRRLWDLLGIARTSSGQTLPKFRLATLQSILAGDEALIGYFWLSDSVVLIMCLDRDRFQVERVRFKPNERKFLDEFVAFIQTFKGANRSMDGSVAKLGTILLPEFCRGFIAAKERIILSPHRSLHLFPFHASRWNGQFVGTRFAVRYVPNFSSLLLPWKNRCQDRVLAIAIKDFSDRDVQSLEQAEEDALAIRRCYTAKGTPVELIIGKEATRERVESLRDQNLLSRFRCAHLGTHGISLFQTPDQPMESKLLLQNAALDAMDLARLRFEAELVVLSACHSGQRAIAGRDRAELPGDDIFGLQSAFFQSGVRSILGTLWHVETRSSSVLIRAFHQHYASGVPIDISLQLAIKDYLKEAPALERSIYYWAPYFITSMGSIDKRA